MPTTTQNTYEYYASVSYTVPCSGSYVDNTQRVISGSLTTIRAATIRRPKPVDLLVSMTNRSHSQVLDQKGLFRYMQPNQCVLDGKWVTYYRQLQQLTAPGYTPMATPSPDWAEAARNKIRSRVVSYAETIGEYRESIRMLEKSAGLLKRAYRIAKAMWRNKRNRRAIINILRRNGRWLVRGDNDRFEFYDLVSADLAIKFGIIPLSGLLHDTLTQASLTRARGFRTQVTVPVHKTVKTPGPLGGTLIQKAEVSSRAILYVRMKDTAGDYTAGSLPEALWAGTRASFMLDWFFNVSSYLSALDAMREVASVRGCVVTKTRIFVQDSRTLAGGYTCVKPRKKLERRYVRNGISSIPLPRISDNGQFNGDHWKLLSAIEVLWSLRRNQ